MSRVGRIAAERLVGAAVLAAVLVGPFLLVARAVGPAFHLGPEAMVLTNLAIWALLFVIWHRRENAKAYAQFRTRIAASQASQRERKIADAAYARGRRDGETGAIREQPGE